MNKLVIYTTTNCPGCKELKAYLDSQNIPYDIKNVSDSMEYRNELVSLGYRAVPVLYNGKRAELGPDKGTIAEMLKEML